MYTKQTNKKVMKIIDLGPITGNNKSFTLSYASPQQIKNQEYSNKCDVYSLGVVFFQLLLGKTPFHYNCGNNINVIKVDLLTTKLRQKGIPENIIKFIEACLKEK